MQLFGLTAIQDAFRARLSTGQPQRAYLLCGPSHSGRGTLGTWMAQTLQCPSGGCLQCQTCLQIANGAHADTFFYHPVEGTGLSVEQAREVITLANHTFTSRFLVFVITEIDQASESALNALLKTLEEPQDRTVFLLTARSVRSLPQTILSRVSILHIPPADPEKLQSYLHERFPTRSPEELAHVRRLSLGRVGQAISLLSDPAALSEAERRMHQLSSALADSPARRLLTLSAMLDRRREAQDPSEIVSAIMHMVRERLLAGNESPVQALARLTMLQASNALLARNVDPRLVATHIATRY